MNCPECAGSTLYNWVLRHANTCTIRDAEDATQNADRERLDQRPWGFTRPATAAEKSLLVAAATHRLTRHRPSSPGRPIGTAPSTATQRPDLSRYWAGPEQPYGG